MVFRAFFSDNDRSSGPTFQARPSAVPVDTVSPVKWGALLLTTVLFVGCGGGGGGDTSASEASAGTSSGTTTGSTTSTGTSAAGSEAPPASLGFPARSSANFFVSGHSLTDDPLAEDLAAIAASLGRQAGWNEQIVIGSPIRVRTSGSSSPPANAAGFSWPGYRDGKNRTGSDMDVVSELRNGTTLGAGQRYDSLLITERHDLLNSLEWENTVRHLRHYHDRLNEGRAGSNTYFYQSWLDVSNRADPRAWIAYERAASPVWQCIATRINQGLAAEGRSDRILNVPANWALAELVERATQGTVAGVTGASVSETMRRLFTDNVHLTRLGSYFQSLVSYSALYGSSPVGVGTWVPPGVTPTQAASLQSLAWQVVSTFSTAQPPLSLGQCRTLLRDSFCSAYGTYRGETGNVAACRNFYTATTSANPLYFDAATNSSYWYPAP